MTNSIEVKTSAGVYPVYIGVGLDYGALTERVAKPCKVVVVSDDNVFPLHGQSVIDSFRLHGYDPHSYVIKHGEESKTLETVTKLLSFLIAENVTRSDLLVALGGGVIGDITGFTAAIYLRGIRFVQIPTTILAAVDSSVGGKTGVDMPAGKNLVGAFRQPIAVLCDTATLATLPDAVYIDGMAEVVKHCVIADRAMLAALDTTPIGEIIERNVAIKARYVEADEFDMGIRKTLNFGHTVGHAIETLSNYGISHGNAVAMGMMVITRASQRRGLTELDCLPQLRTALERLDLSTRCEFSATELATVALHDKKRSDASITLIVPRRIGAVELYDLPVSDLEDFIREGLNE